MPDERLDSPRRKTIKFSMEKDEKARVLAKKAHSVAVLLKEAGFPIKSITNADNLKIRKEFKLPRTNSYSVFDFIDQGEDKNAEIVDWINMNTTGIKVHGFNITQFRDKTKVFRIVMDCTSV